MSKYDAICEMSQNISVWMDSHGCGVLRVHIPLSLVCVSVQPELILNMPGASMRDLLLRVYSLMGARKGYQVLRTIVTIVVFHYGGIALSKVLYL